MSQDDSCSEPGGPLPPDAALSETQFRRYAEDLIRVYREEKAKRRELQAANEKIQTVLDAMSDGMVAVDGSGIVIEANAGMCRMLGCERENLCGQRLADLAGGEELARELAEVSAAREQGRRILDLTLRDRHILRTSLSGMRDGCVVALARDVTVERRTQNIKVEFLALLSHELRTPLNGILGISGLLGDSDVSRDEIREYAVLLRESGERMARTVNELLNFADLQLGRIESMDESVDVAAEAGRIVRNIADEAMLRAMTVALRAESPESRVRGNTSMIRDMIWHLADNAIKFGRGGGRVDVVVDRSGGHVRVRVMDDGPGVPARERDRIFNSFYQIQEYMTRNREGLGLGLTLARRIAEMHGGRLELVEEHAPGACFQALLPVVAGAEAAASASGR